MQATRPSEQSSDPAEQQRQHDQPAEYLPIRSVARHCDPRQLAQSGGNQGVVPESEHSEGDRREGDANFAIVFYTTSQTDSHGARLVSIFS
jgi:hypothetical protein